MVQHRKFLLPRYARHSTRMFRAVIALLFGVLLSACDRKLPYQQFEGNVATAHYRVNAQLPKHIDVAALQVALEQRIEQINQTLSLSLPLSEVNQFNALAPQQSLSVSVDFIQLLTLSRKINQQSAGAFDPTIAALVELWGFAAQTSFDHHSRKVPAALAIKQAQANKGLQWVQQQQQRVSRTAPVNLDFYALADGFAADSLAAVLQANGVRNYLVEFAGEITAHGVSARGTPWRIAIEAPEELQGKNFTAVLLHSPKGGTVGLATSGDYRNFYEVDGVRYSHIIDPVTGYPIKHRLTSVTVIADTGAVADGWATALMVLGEDAGFKLAQQQHLAAYMIYHDGKQLAFKYTDAMRSYLDAGR